MADAPDVWSADVPPDLSAFPTVQHRIEKGRFVCPGDETASCHQYPACDHETWPCGCDYVPHADCWIKPWIDGSDLVDSYAGDEPYLRDEDLPDGDATWTFEGDYVLFDYVLASREASDA
ncbi:hypothetical protein [Microbacterium karelineae]|uniref:hypothetical protein n=1 Tax=Microbacterium karelineae TaxID=2654283 RepID=UPI0012EA9448|nr:hypothetical protein [Microbacterium karelineae]